MYVATQYKMPHSKRTLTIIHNDDTDGSYEYIERDGNGHTCSTDDGLNLPQVQAIIASVVEAFPDIERVAGEEL